MKPVPEFEGLKFPDEFLVRHFFKHGLHVRQGRVLELGCGNGSNLSLYGHYGWDIGGIDIEAALIAHAKANLGDKAHLTVADLSGDFAKCLSGLYDVLLLPSVMYYVQKEDCIAAFKKVAPFLSKGAYVYWRMRLLDDYRFGRGALIAPNCYRLATPETGEDGAINCFYACDELIEMGVTHLGLEDIVTMKLAFDNVQNDQMIANSEIIIWGRAYG
jgi:SAM-dependent methyltransferase